jgi:predicted GNAT family acetyltransferase
MTVHRHEDPTDFWATAGDWFQQDPVRNTIAITVLRQLVDLGPSDGDQPPILLTVNQNGVLAGAAVQTPPWPLLVSGLPINSHQEIINSLDTIQGVAGPKDIAEPFTRAWLAKSGQDIASATDVLLYELGDLATPEIPGTAQLGTKDDLDLIAEWWDAFATELDHFGIPCDGVNNARRAIDFGRAIGLWFDNGEPVAMAIASPTIAGMSRIGPVYTPPEHRGHGYAKAVTAHVAQWAIDSGAKHVLLFADVNNPVSNKVYQSIGFQIGFDGVEYTFTDRHTVGL